ncbi:MAG: hypothetical protein OFPII_41230 [Osedax symbiont Rs1]|nr:MAG: hypothetical protein OFPII_41230 [Osedax symbiont Rs1]
MSNKQPIAIAHWLVPLCIIVFCLLAFWQTTHFERVPPILKRGIQPEDFPQLILIFIILLALAVMIKDRCATQEILNSKVWQAIGLIPLFALVSQIDLFFGLSLFSMALCYQWGERRAKAFLLLGLIVPLIIFFFFDQVFNIRFPRGVFTNLWYG